MKEATITKRIIAALALAAPALLSLAAPRAGLAATHAVRGNAALPPGTVWKGDYTFSNMAASKCLDADTTMGGVNGNKVQIWDCNAEPQQDWHVYQASNGAFYIVNAKYNKCLDMNLTTFPSDGEKIQLWDCNYQKQQSWDLNAFFDSSAPTLGFHQVYAYAATRYVLDADNSHGLGDGSKVQLWENLSGNNQFWHIWPFG